MYSWGGGGKNKNFGQHGRPDKNLSEPDSIDFFKGKPVLQIACGDYHTMVLLENRELFAFGQGESGELGTGKKESSHHPRKVLLSFDSLEDNFGGK